FDRVGRHTAGDGAKLLGEVQPPQEKRQRGPPVGRLLWLDALYLVGVRTEEIKHLAVGDKQLPGWIGVLPAHLAGPQQIEGPPLLAPDPATVGHFLLELHLHGAEPVVVLLDSTGNRLGRRGPSYAQHHCEATHYI